VYVHDMQSGKSVLSSMQLCLQDQEESHCIALAQRGYMWVMCMILFDLHLQCIAVRPTGARLSQPEKETSTTSLMQDSNQKTTTCSHTGSDRDFSDNSSKYSLRLAWGCVNFITTQCYYW